MKSPSKHLSIEFLENLIVNNFVSETGIEYPECEVRDLLFEKYTIKDNKNNKELIRQYNQINKG